MNININNNNIYLNIILISIIIKFIRFYFFNIVDTANELDKPINNILILRPKNEKSKKFIYNDVYTYYICIDIDLIGYIKMLFNKCLKHKYNEELIKKYKNKIISNKNLFINNCYKKDFN